jgi:hypothetical protein
MQKDTISTFVSVALSPFGAYRSSQGTSSEEQRNDGSEELHGKQVQGFGESEDCRATTQ